MLERTTMIASSKTLTERFQDRIIEEKAREQEYKRNQQTTQINIEISYGKNGDLKIKCENSRDTRYLFERARALFDNDQLGLTCYFATKDDGCNCFYIGTSDSARPGQQSIVHHDARVLRGAKLTKYGIYLPTPRTILKRDGVTTVTEPAMIAMNCPGGAEGRNYIIKLFGLTTQTETDQKVTPDCYVQIKPKHSEAWDNARAHGIDSQEWIEFCKTEEYKKEDLVYLHANDAYERSKSAIYFNPAVLPPNQGSTQIIKKCITIENSSLREQFVEKKPAGAVEAADNKPRLYSGKDAPLILNTALTITNPATYLSYENHKPYLHDKMIVTKNTAFKQSGYHGWDSSTMTLKWVGIGKDMKLVVSYYSSRDLVEHTGIESAVYLLSFNPDDTIATELLASPNPTQSKNHSTPSGGEILDMLAEWGCDMATKLKKEEKPSLKKKPTLLNKPKKEDEDEDDGDDNDRSQIRDSARDNLSEALFEKDLFRTLSSDRKEIETAFTTLTTLYDSLKPKEQENKNVSTFKNRIQSTKRILALVSDIDETDILEDSKKLSAVDEQTRNTTSPSISLSSTKKTQLIEEFNIIIRNDPSLWEKTWLENGLRALGIMTVVLIPAVMLYNHYEYKSHVEKTQKLASDTIGTEVRDFETSAWKTWGLS